MSEQIYPDSPGFKVSGPSEQAAKAITGSANKMRAAVLARIAFEIFLCQFPGGRAFPGELLANEGVLGHGGSHA